MQKKILLIDNDPDILAVMQEALDYEGFEVFTASKAEDIVSLVCNIKPDLLLIDYILDGINGGELCHQLKADHKTAALPVIIISAYPRVLKSLGYYGCDAFIPKPFDLYDLIDQINSYSCISTKYYN